MTGTLTTKTTTSGKEFFYMKLCYKDAKTGTWKQKYIKTGLLTKGNKRRAEKMLADALEKNAYLENQCMSDNDDFTPETMLTDYLLYWIDLKKPELKKTTWEGYEARIRNTIKYFEPKSYRLIDVTPRIIDRFFRYLLSYGKTNQKTKEPEPLSVRSTRSYKSLLHAAFSQAMVEGLVSANPVDNVKVRGKKNRDYAEEYLFMTEEEVQDMLRFLSGYNPRLVAIAFFAAYYGLRRSELLGLKWSAVDYGRRLIHIRHTIVRSKSIVAADLTKTFAGRRSLNLFPTAELCLEKLKNEQNEYRALFGNTYQNKQGYVFTWEDGRSYDPDYITGIFTKAMTDFGRPEITLHKLRHTCASILINRGWDIKKLQYWLGHVDANTTLNIYAHFNRQRMNEAADDLEEISSKNADLFS